MPKILNSYAADTSIGDTLAQLGNSLWGPQAASVGLARSKMRAQDRENENVPLLADAVTRGDLDAMIRHGIMAGNDPKNVAGYNQFRVVTQQGPRTDQALAATMAVPGSNYDNTVQGVDAKLRNARVINDMTTARMMAMERYKADNTPVNVVLSENGVTRAAMLPRSEALRNRATPVLSSSEAQGLYRQGGFASGYQGYNPAQLEAAGVTPREDTVMNVVTPSGTQPAIRGPNGFVNAQTGQPITEPISAAGKLTAQTTEGLQPPTKVANDIYTSRVGTMTAVNAIGNLRKELRKTNADQALGWVGQGARLFTDVRSQVEATLRAVSPGGLTADQELRLNPDVQATLDRVLASPNVAQRIRQLGIQSAVIRSQIQDLAYMISKARDPSGRVSNQDVEHAATIVGGALMDPQSGDAVLGNLADRLVTEQNIREDLYRRTFPNARHTPAPDYNVQSPPMGAQQAPRVRKFIRGPDGEPVEVQ